MGLINTKCPQCGLDYPTSDQIHLFKWYCSEECESRAKPKHKEDTWPDFVEEVTDDISQEVYDSELFKL